MGDLHHSCCAGLRLAGVLGLPCFSAYSGGWICSDAGEVGLPIFVIDEAVTVAIRQDPVLLEPLKPHDDHLVNGVAVEAANLPSGNS